MRCYTLLMAVVILVVEGCALGQSARSPAYNSVQQGVYSTTQAARGEAVWNSHCAECHFPEEYSNGYLYAWSGENLFDLYAYLRITMPYLAPGTLENEEYVDVAAFLLSRNLLPAGDAELKADRQALQGILIEGPF